MAAIAVAATAVETVSNAIGAAFCLLALEWSNPQVKIMGFIQSLNNLQIE